jgi:ABC-type ATPase with predicted acetyltransferase domain
MPLTLRAEFEVRPPSPGDNARRVAEQFGVGRRLVRRVVWDGQTVTPGPGRVLLFTGRSGSGKSTALSLLAAAAGPTDRVLWLHRRTLRPGTALIDQFDGSTYAEAARLLTRAGLGDSKLWVLSPGQLSEGQRYRAGLAALYWDAGAGGRGNPAFPTTCGAEAPRPPAGGTTLLLLDEFCATLDRELAGTVCANLRRMVSETPGLCAAAATTHDDVGPRLAPDEWWHRPDGETAVRRTAEAPAAPAPPVIEIPARVAGEFIAARHYKGGIVPGSVRSYGLFDGERLIGALMMSHPPPSLQAHLSTGVNFHRDGLTAVQRIRETLLINRAVVDDAYRGRGLGRHLVTRALEKCGAQTVLVVAEMAKHNPVFAAAGMRPAGIARSGKPFLMWHRSWISDL